VAKRYVVNLELDEHEQLRVLTRKGKVVAGPVQIEGWSLSSEDASDLVSSRRNREAIGSACPGPGVVATYQWSRYGIALRLAIPWTLSVTASSPRSSRPRRSSIQAVSALRVSMPESSCGDGLALRVGALD
jgi:hypothetical protein